MISLLTGNILKKFDKFVILNVNSGNLKGLLLEINERLIIFDPLKFCITSFKGVICTPNLIFPSWCNFKAIGFTEYVWLYVFPSFIYSIVFISSKEKLSELSSDANRPSILKYFERIL